MPNSAVTIRAVAAVIANQASITYTATLIATAEKAMVMAVVSMLRTVRVCAIHFCTLIAANGVPAVNASIADYIMWFCFCE
jgi:hypothetical protein